MPKPIVVVVEVPEVQQVTDKRERVVGYLATAYLAGTPFRGTMGDSIDHARALSLRAIEHALGREYVVVHSLFMD